MDGYTSCTKRYGVVDEINAFGKRDYRMVVTGLLESSLTETKGISHGSQTIHHSESIFTQNSA